jgi:hypothetical protein
MQQAHADLDSVEVSFPKAWKRYRLLWWMSWGSWLGLFPIELLIGVPLCLLFGSSLPFNLIAVTLMTTFVVGGLCMGFWQCPRCLNDFHRRGVRSNFLARRCLHCGLRKRGRC